MYNCLEIDMKYTKTLTLFFNTPNFVDVKVHLLLMLYEPLLILTGHPPDSSTALHWLGMLLPPGDGGPVTTRHHHWLGQTGL